jgi:hypothetical protein
MNQKMSDALHPGDPLDRMADQLRQAVPVVAGLEERVAARRRRHRRQAAFTRGAGALLAVALTTVLARDALRTGIPVTFELTAPQVGSVALVGDFTDWQADRVRLKAEGGGEWKVTLRLPPGRYRFAYVLDDGEWRGDASAAPALDDFGRPTSVMTVAGK